MFRRKTKVRWLKLPAILLIFLAVVLWDKFSNSKEGNDVNSIILDKDTASIYFSPEGGCESAIANEIDMAKKTIDAAIYTFTSRSIAQALVSARKRGVAIRVIMDKSMADDKFSKLRYLQNHNINVITHNTSGLMHNKIAIIDSSIVITGSFNWTASAQKNNYENIIILKSPQLAQAYGKYFQWMWEKFNRHR